MQESEELVINAVATINNLSFYQGESSVIRSQHTHISQCKCVCEQPVCSICLGASVMSSPACPSVIAVLLKLLLSSSMDAVLEATRVFGNLSQIKDVRHFIVQQKGVRHSLCHVFSKAPVADVCVGLLCLSGAVCGNPPGLQDP